MLAALEAVDLVVVFEEDTPIELLKRVRPRVLVKGGDYRPDEVVGRDLVEADGGEVILVELLPGHSTTGIVRRSGNPASELQTADAEARARRLQRLGALSTVTRLSSLNQFAPPPPARACPLAVALTLSIRARSDCGIDGASAPRNCNKLFSADVSSPSRVR